MSMDFRKIPCRIHPNAEAWAKNFNEKEANMKLEVKRHAETLLKYSLGVKPGEKVLIQGDVVTLPLMLECYRIALDLGAFPQVNLTHGEFREILLKRGNAEQIQFVPPSQIKMLETVDCMLTLWGEINTRMLSQVEPEKLKLSAQGNAEVYRTLFSRIADNSLRWCGTLHPTLANAQEASMSLAEYEDFVYDACMLHDPDPAARWLELHNRQNRICEYLDTKKTYRIVSEGTDIRMSVAGRKWINCSGKMNFPDGEVFTAPIEDSVEGTIRFSFPGIYNGREIEDIKLTFEKGKVVNATASKGEDLLLQLLDTDAGSRFVGEVAVGTNYNIRKFTHNMLFDEKIGGTVHMALGRAIPESGGTNVSAIHWDMLCDMRHGGEVYADDEVIYKDGHFLI
jgi:aminopeptidase